MNISQGKQDHPRFSDPPLSSRHLFLDLLDPPHSFDIPPNLYPTHPDTLWTSVTKRSSMVGDRPFGTRLIPDPGRPRAISLDVSMRPECPSGKSLWPVESRQSKPSTIIALTPRPSPRPNKKSLNSITQEERPGSPTRSLWLGNLSPSVTIPTLMAVFDAYGPIENIRILIDRECAFVNFFRIEDALKAKAHFQPQTDLRLGHVKVGFGNPECPPLHEPPTRQPTRALWIGNIPSTTTPTMLFSVFAPFGSIQSVRILGHRNCGFINFRNQEDAQAAKVALKNKEMFGCAVRLGYAKVLGVAEPEDQNNFDSLVLDDPSMLVIDANVGLPLALENDRRNIVRMLSETDRGSLENSSSRRFKYSNSIPAAPEFGQSRQIDTGRLRDVRRRLETGHVSTAELEDLATMCPEDFVALCSDPIGNTIVQHIFERCCESTRIILLTMAAPYLASIGTHRNGTWAAQKIIETALLPEKVCTSIKPFVPLLLLDQFGNYVVQCCLGLGPEYNQFIFDGIVDACWEISQGRFGARAVRATLENPQTTKEQQIYVAAALIQHSLLLITNPNGSLLLIWLLDSSQISRRYSALVQRLLPNLGRLCTHKLASLTILKIIQQDQEPDVRRLLLDRLFYDEQPQVDQILIDQVHGVGFIQRVLSSSLDLCERRRIADNVWLAMFKNELYRIQGYKRLLEEMSVLGSDYPPNVPPPAYNNAQTANLSGQTYYQPPPLNNPPPAQPPVPPGERKNPVMTFYAPPQNRSLGLKRSDLAQVFTASPIACVDVKYFL
ncbi:armadillo-type protein [Phycomyces nitens]|nr:armadillo-type protein [Phycomyces nitens]